MKKVMKVLNRVFTFSFACAVISAFSSLVLLVYSFFAYTDSYFTTSSNFEPLEKIAPILHKFIVNGCLGFIAFGIVCLLTIYLAKMLKKGRR